MLLWYRPEESTSSREGFAVSTETGGSDLGGSVAAALAASSVVFQSLNDTTYARDLLDKALDVSQAVAGCVVRARGQRGAGLGLEARTASA